VVRVNLAIGPRSSAGPGKEAMHIESRRAPEAAVVAAMAFVLALFLPVTRMATARATSAGATAQSPRPGVLSPALWDSVAALRRTLGVEAGPESNGACLRDEHNIEFYIQNERSWTEHHRARTLAIEDPVVWDETDLGPDLYLPDGAQLLRTALFVLAPGGAELQSFGDEARRLDPAERSPCGSGRDRLRLQLPTLQQHTLLRWEVDWREPTATTRATHWFGGDRPVLESRFSFVFPKAYLDTDWGQFVRAGAGAAAGMIPQPVIEDEVGPLQKDRRYTYRARWVAPDPSYPFSAPIAERVPHISILPELGGPESHAELLALCNRMEGAAALDAATREALLAPIIARTARPVDRAKLLRETVMTRVRLSPGPPQARDGIVRLAPETWDSGCGTSAEIAALLLAGLRELNFPAQPLLARSSMAGPPDTTASDPSEFDRILVEVGSAEAEASDEATGGETILDASCPLCPWGYLRADLQGLPAVGMNHGAARWRLLPSFPAGTNWMRRTVVMEPQTNAMPTKSTVSMRPTEDGPPPFAVTVERIAFGEPALRAREAGGMTAPGEEVLPPPVGVSRGVELPSRPAARPPGVPGELAAAGPLPGAPSSRDRSSPLLGAGDLDGPVTVRDTLRLDAERTDDGWRLPESLLGHRGLLPGLSEIPLGGSRCCPVMLPHTLVLADSTVIVLPRGWTATSLPAPTMVQGAGFQFTTRARFEDGRVIVIGLLAMEETRFTGARVRDLVEFASAIEAKDARGIMLRKE
jgi:hypothetical protein